jgi:chromosome segregation ATPase
VIEYLLALVGILLSATIGAAFEYLRQIRKAKKEYEKAKDAVEDIVLSFNRELKREADRLELIAYKVEGSSAKADTGLKRIDGIEKKVAPLENQLGTISENNINVLARLTDADTKIHNIEASQETLKTKITGLEEQVQKFVAAPTVMSEPVMPIKRDKAMAALTDTEVTVLEMLSTEGSKTAPEIKDRVQLSREHTARLMKKLYEEGYLEMEKFLKKAESAQA